jgi:adenylate cyclase
LPAGDGLVWEVDCFEGDNAGLIIAEIELPTIGTEIELPDWLGQEVTGDAAWSNACLALEPRPQDS